MEQTSLNNNNEDPEIAVLPFEKGHGDLSLADVPLENVRSSSRRNDGSTSAADDQDSDDYKSDYDDSDNIPYIVIGSLIFMALFTLAFGLGFGLSNNNDHSDTQVIDAPGRKMSFDQLVKYLVAQGVSSYHDLTNEGSPQNLAAVWMATYDKAAVKIPYVGITNKIGYMFVVRYVMALLYYAFDGKDWTNQLNFLSSDYICAWSALGSSFENANVPRREGLGCDSVLGTPTSLDLEFVNLNGEIPTEIGVLSSLTALNLNFNPFVRGTIPVEFCHLTNIEALALTGTSLSGTIPMCISSISNLNVFQAANTKLAGSLSAGLCELANLSFLRLSQNEFTGRLPSCMSSLTSLLNLDLSWNAFTGELPTDLSSWSQMMVFNIHGNRFAGKLPDGMETWTKLAQFVVSENDLTGELPSQLGGWTRMQNFSVYDNNFRGQLPSGMGNWTNLISLRASNNGFTGELPADLANLKGNDKFKELYLDGNSFQGDPITILNNLEFLTHLLLSDNHFAGQLDAFFIRSLLDLEVIDLSSNNFTSKEYAVPTHLFKLGSIQVLDLSKNNLQGELPPDIPENDKLGFFGVHNNVIVGTIPPSLSNLRQLMHLDLSHNYFTGPIPDEIFKFDRLYHLILADNPRLQPGPVPSTLGAMNQLTELSLKKTNRNSTLPALNGFSVLQLLDLGDNKFTGPIPASYGQLESLRYLLLNRNNITGAVPDLSGATNLRTILLDGTKLTGNLTTVCNLPKFSNVKPNTDADIVAIANCDAADSLITCDCCFCCTGGATEACSDPEVESLDWTWEQEYQQAVRNFGPLVNTNKTKSP